MHRIKGLILPVALLILMIYVYGGNIGTIDATIDQPLSDDIIGEISDGVEIEQTFYSPVNNISGFSIKLGTYMRENQGDIVFGIRKKATGRVIYSTRVKAESIVDNAYFDYRFPPIKGSRDQEYTIFIKSVGSPLGKSITAYRSSYNTYKEGELLVNHTKVDGDLAFKVVYNQTLF